MLKLGYVMKCGFGARCKRAIIARQRRPTGYYQQEYKLNESLHSLLGITSPLLRAAQRLWRSAASGTGITCLSAVTDPLRSLAAAASWETLRLRCYLRRHHHPAFLSGVQHPLTLL